MIAISNRNFDIITNKLPHVLNIARQGISLTLRQREDIRQLQLLCEQLKRNRK